jgi:hypothetical protein
MSNKEDKSLDVLGIKSFGDSINKILDGVGAFLGSICLPAAEEYGLLLRDKVSYWRAKNLEKITQKAKDNLRAQGDSNGKHAHPRIVASIIEKGSWSDINEVQDMWAGLLASSCTEDGTDETNLIYTNLLSQLISSQARLLNHFCKNSEKHINRGGRAFIRYPIEVGEEDLKELSSIRDIHRISRELEHLVSLGLIEGKYDYYLNRAHITPTPLALDMYVRCQGTTQSPIEFFGLQVPK